MTNFNPLNFIANHAGMNLADAIQEAYEQGKKDAQPERKPYHEVWISALRTAPPERVCRGCKHEPRCSHEEPCGSCSNNYVNKWEGKEHV